MKTSLKTLSIAAIIVAIAVPLVLYQPVMATETNDNDNPSLGKRLLVKQRCRVALILKFLKQAEPTSVMGEAAALVKNILVLNVDGEQVRVLMPPKWTTPEGEVIVREALINNIGDKTITIEALQANFENPQGITINLVVGYEIASGERNFYAVLPFNLDID